MRGFLRNGSARAPGITARIESESVRGLSRNHCALSPGIHPRFAPEYAQTEKYVIGVARFALGEALGEEELESYPNPLSARHRLPEKVNDAVDRYLSAKVYALTAPEADDEATEDTRENREAARADASVLLDRLEITPERREELLRAYFERMGWKTRRYENGRPTAYKKRVERLSIENT